MSVETITTAAYYLWPTASAVGWFAGATTLQLRAKKQPIDFRLNAAVLAITVIAFHLVAYMIIAVKEAAGTFIVIPVDATLLAAALILLWSRVELVNSFFRLFLLVLLSSFSFWLWYINALGGLFPR